MTLPPKKDRKPRRKRSHSKDRARFDTRPRQKKGEVSYDTGDNGRRSYDTRIIDGIGVALEWRIKSIDNKHLIDELHGLVKSGVSMSEPDPVFLKFLSGIEKKQSKKIDMKKFLISKSIKYCYFGLRQAVPQIKSFEKIVDGLLTKDVKKIGVGIVETFAGESFTTILVQLVES